MIAVIEDDRRLARRLTAALEERGHRVRMAHGYADARALVAAVVPVALYVSEVLEPASGGDLLADLERVDRLAVVPTLVRVTRDDSLFARAIRSGGLLTIVRPFVIEATAALLERMAQGREGTLRRLVHESRMSKPRTADDRDAAVTDVTNARDLRKRGTQTRRRANSR